MTSITLLSLPSIAALIWLLMQYCVLSAAERRSSMAAQGSDSRFSRFGWLTAANRSKDVGSQTLEENNVLPDRCRISMDNFARLSSVGALAPAFSEMQIFLYVN